VIFCFVFSNPNFYTMYLQYMGTMNIESSATTELGNPNFCSMYVHMSTMNIESSAKTELSFVEMRIIRLDRQKCKRSGCPLKKA
jgi:hypothetical protein